MTDEMRKRAEQLATEFVLNIGLGIKQKTQPSELIRDATDRLADFASQVEREAQNDTDHWWHEADYLRGELEQLHRAYEIVAMERDGYRDLLHKQAELKAEVLSLQPKTIILDKSGVAASREEAGDK